MKTKPILATLALLTSLTPVFAALNIPDANGSDGPLNASGTTYPIDLSQAIPGDALTFSNTPGNMGKGIYDAARWVVVFKYSSVSVPLGTTVTFTNHPSRAPVVWLVQGNVDIAGTVSVNGRNGVAGSTADTPVEPGPGGFRGGVTGPNGTGAGLGPGGGASNNIAGVYTTYGRPNIFPLIGGSGGAGWVNVGSGGGAGGAILIAAPGAIQISGSITALGGQNSTGGNFGNSVGSGGAIKLIADQVTGTGSLNAGSLGGAALFGRVRIEANTLSAGIATTPPTVTQEPGAGATPVILQSLTAPTVRIKSVDGVASPADPSAPLSNTSDLSIQNNAPVVISLETFNFPTAGATVAVRIANKNGAAGTPVNATLDTNFTNTTAHSTWKTAPVTIAPGFTTLQARATGP